VIGESVGNSCHGKYGNKSEDGYTVYMKCYLDVDSVYIGSREKETLHEDYEDLNYNYIRRNSRHDSTSNSPNAKPG
jgi:hypothetical protein